VLKPPWSSKQVSQTAPSFNHRANWRTTLSRLILDRLAAVRSNFPSAPLVIALYALQHSISSTSEKTSIRTIASRATSRFVDVAIMQLIIGKEAAPGPNAVSFVASLERFVSYVPATEGGIPRSSR
jgi:hypothetical protein